MNGVLFIGFRGAGKSTLAQMVAQESSMVSIDCDTLLEKKLSCSLVTYFEKFGELAFRKKEYEVLQELQDKTYATFTLCALGGGFVDFADSVKLVHEWHWPKIYIQANAQDIWQRLQNSPERLQVKNIQKFSDFEQLYMIRSIAFEQLADFIVPNTNNKLKNAAHKVKEICQQIQLQGISDNLGAKQ